MKGTVNYLDPYGMEPDEQGKAIRRQLEAYCVRLERRNDPDDLIYSMAMFREFYRQLRLTAVRMKRTGQYSGARVASSCGVSKQALFKWEQEFERDGSL